MPTIKDLLESCKGIEEIIEREAKESAEASVPAKSKRERRSTEKAKLREATVPPVEAATPTETETSATGTKPKTEAHGRQKEDRSSSTPQPHLLATIVDEPAILHANASDRLLNIRSSTGTEKRSETVIQKLQIFANHPRQAKKGMMNQSTD